MNLDKLTKTIFMLATAILWLPLQAQVTIGSDEEPVEGALLQLKDTKGVTTNASNSTKGVVFPRVALSQKDRLYPMFGTTLAEDPLYTANLAAYNARHAGLIVYNTYTSPVSVTNANLIFQEGLYVWLGDRWASAGTPSVDNGLNITNTGTVRLGGKLVQNTSIDMNGNALDITTGGKDFSIKGLDVIQTDATSLVVDVNTGKIGKANVTPTKLTFVQSQTATALNPSEGMSGNLTQGASKANVGNSALTTIPGPNGTTSTSHPHFRKNLNWGKKIVVPFKLEDIITSIDVTTPIYAGELDPGDPEYVAGNNTKIVAFELMEDFTVELTGYVNYSPMAANNADIVVNLTMQVRMAKRDPVTGLPVYDPVTGEPELSDWEDYSSVRALLVEAMPWYRNTINLPPAVFAGVKGEQIRMIIMRPYDVTGTTATFLGGGHGYGPDGTTTSQRFKNVQITIPYGTKFSSGIKITAIG